mgnify:CR=1 FL=1
MAGWLVGDPENVIIIIMTRTKCVSSITAAAIINSRQSRDKEISRNLKNKKNCCQTTTKHYFERLELSAQFLQKRKKRSRIFDEKNIY